MIAPILVVLLQTALVSPATATAQAAAATSPARATVSGAVHDSTGGSISGAIVIVRSSSGAEVRTVSGMDGSFTATVMSGTGNTLIVRAEGFSEYRQPLAAAGTVDVKLTPATHLETVTVTPAKGEQRLMDVPASMTVLDRSDIRQSPAVVADDLLRQVPTFSLFRRASSVTTHPTTQGVSLRGIGPSGVSRTLVLLDGVPFNDPFGGWVNWSRVPLEGLNRIEVVNGSSSSLYGNYAMGGVINMVTTPAARRAVEFTTQYGNRNTPKVDVVGSDVYGKLGITVNASAFDTDGFPPVVDVNPAGATERGLVDNNARVNFKNVGVKLDYAASDRVEVFFRGGYFDEHRDNGKKSTVDGVGTEEANRTNWKSTSGGVRLHLADRSEVQATIFTDNEDFHSNFLAVPAATPARSVGRMSLNQFVPTKNVGGMAQWSRVFGRMHAVSAGTDFRWVDGDSNEDSLDAVTGTTVTLHRVSGGTQQSAGVFAQDLMTLTSKLSVTISARFDHWRNYDAHNLETNIPAGTPGAGNNPNLPGRQDDVASPRIAALYHVTDRVSVWGNIGEGFRAPTLNELYRQFRQGTTLTLANNQLTPERLHGGEIGASLQPAKNLAVSATYFDNRIKDPVANVTLSVAAGTTTVQRQNLGRTRVWGFQTDVEYRLGNSLKFSGAYLYDDARVVAFDANPALVNNCGGVAGQPVTGKACYLPQVPKNRGSFEVSYSNPRLVDVTLDVQAVGNQFDDDQNIRAVPGIAAPGLPKYTVVNLSVSRSISRNLDVFVGAQNLADRQFFVGTLPTLVGAPRSVNGGVRVKFAGR